MKRFPFHLGLTFAVALIFCQTSPASAQRGNQSDVTGAIVTGSDVSGGTFSGQSNGNIGVRGSDISGGTFSPTLEGEKSFRVVFTNPRVQAAVNETGGRILSQLNTNTITSIDGISIPNETQQTLLTILTASESQQVNVDSKFTNTLVSVKGGPTTKQAEQLVRRLKGLVKARSAKTGKVEATKLLKAIQAYNSLINSSSVEYLNNPPSGLLAIQSVMSQLINSVSSQRR